jgi:sec-independent protein translocase protein TatB
MFGLSAIHLAILLVVGLFVFGPERLPTMLRDVGKALRQVRQTAQTMQDELKAELGPEVGDLDLRSLHPRTFVEKHLFGDEEDPLGLDFLRKDAEPVISFNKSNGAAPQQAGAQAQQASAGDAPDHAPTSQGTVKFDLDAT